MIYPFFFLFFLHEKIFLVCKMEKVNLEEKRNSNRLNKTILKENCFFWWEKQN